MTSGTIDIEEQVIGDRGHGHADSRLENLENPDRYRSSRDAELKLHAWNKTLTCLRYEFDKSSRDNREKGVSASETPFSLFCRDNFSENMVSVCVCHFFIVSYTKDGKRIDSVIFSGHGCISNQDGKFAPNWHADMPLTLEEGTLTSNGEITSNISKTMSRNHIVLTHFRLMNIQGKSSRDSTYQSIIFFCLFHIPISAIPLHMKRNSRTAVLFDRSSKAR